MGDPGRPQARVKSLCDRLLQSPSAPGATSTHSRV
jgi:hypothetical protein